MPATVQDDIAKGRLVVPFEFTLPVDAGFYLVSPQNRADPPKLVAFRNWLTSIAQTQPEPLADTTKPARRQQL